MKVKSASVPAIVSALILLASCSVMPGLQTGTTGAETAGSSAAATTASPSPAPTATSSPASEPVIKTVTLSFAGDCTLGSDPAFGYSGTFTEVFDTIGGDYAYFFKNVRSIFDQDDLTIVNLETTLTTATVEKEKRFNFKGDPSYVNILLKGGVEVVNLANNHTMDYLEQGLADTADNLTSAGVDYYGYNTVAIREVDGITVGFAGFCPFDDAELAERQLREAMQKMAEADVDLRIATFHWGVETKNYYNEAQSRLAELAVDLGADLVVGHHPHVLQGISQYKGAYIVYSLANFVFGGNRNPKDKDSMITQHSFTFTDGELTGQDIRVYPVRISSRSDKNDYQPFVPEGDEADRIIGRINDYSQDLKITGDMIGRISG